MSNQIAVLVFESESEVMFSVNRTEFHLEDDLGLTEEQVLAMFDDVDFASFNPYQYGIELSIVNPYEWMNDEGEDCNVRLASISMEPLESKPIVAGRLKASELKEYLSKGGKPSYDKEYDEALDEEIKRLIKLRKREFEVEAVITLTGNGMVDEIHIDQDNMSISAMILDPEIEDESEAIVAGDGCRYWPYHRFGTTNKHSVRWVDFVSDLDTKGNADLDFLANGRMLQAFSGDKQIINTVIPEEIVMTDKLVAELSSIKWEG
ncbi:hypothetical protein [Vibrio barjaei]|uniref:hypothetical protein n=1 Tax=Vibrio barjaei TaxID=1676683 RepID=UPI00228390A5|nr:hypothetical protein [Vibrio barjaei]MCY9874597.1 hypothetical protein [Vibrio barjaei]